MNQYHIAIIEDDDSMRELLRLNLKAEEFAVDAFISVEELKKKVGDFRKIKIDYDLIILDNMLPGTSGVDFAKQLQNLKIPILFISALNQQKKIEEAYSFGAIDYLTKPFELATLIAKVKNLSRYFIQPKQEALPNQIGNCIINWKLMNVTKKNQEFKLSVKEINALSLFLTQPNEIIGRNDLIEKIWGGSTYVSTRNIDNIVVKLRRIFEEDPSNPKLFKTYPKKGYAYLDEQ